VASFLLLAATASLLLRPPSSLLQPLAAAASFLAAAALLPSLLLRLPSFLAAPPSIPAALLSSNLRELSRFFSTFLLSSSLPLKRDSHGCYVQIRPNTSPPFIITNNTNYYLKLKPIYPNQLASFATFTGEYFFSRETRAGN
jgi:hypothetical protein